MYVTHLKEVVVGHSKAARMSFLMCPYFLFKIPLSEQFSPYFGSRLVGKYAYNACHMAVSHAVFHSTQVHHIVMETGVCNFDRNPHVE